MMESKRELSGAGSLARYDGKSRAGKAAGTATGGENEVMVTIVLAMETEMGTNEEVGVQSTTLVMWKEPVMNGQIVNVLGFWRKIVLVFVLRYANQS